MTIDSDSDTEHTDRKPVKRSKPIVKEEDEEILLGHTVIMNEAPTDEPVQVKVGSHQQWKFTDILQLDAAKKEPELEFEINDKDDRPPF
jgi:hypothetical protein